MVTLDPEQHTAPGYSFSDELRIQRVVIGLIYVFFYELRTANRVRNHFLSTDYEPLDRQN